MLKSSAWDLKISRFIQPNHSGHHSMIDLIKPGLNRHLGFRGGHMRVRKVIFVVVLFILTAAMLAACGQEASSEFKAAKAGEMSVFPYSDPVSMVTTGGNEIGMGAPETLPNGLPNDIPIHPGHVLNWTTTKAADKPRPSYNIFLATTTDASSAEKWYREQLEKGGWQIGAAPAQSIPAQPGDAEKKGEFMATNGNRSLDVSFFLTSDRIFPTQIGLVYRESN
jgi:hypothetical protein